MVELAAETGYSGVTVRGLSRLAGVSTKTFYKCFENTEDCFAATYGWIAWSTLRPRAGVSERYGDQLRGRVHMMFSLLAEDPKAAHLILVESFAGGPAVVGRAKAATSALERLVKDEFTSSLTPMLLPTLVSQAVICAALRVARSRLLAAPATEVPAIADAFHDWLAALRNERPVRSMGSGQLVDSSNEAEPPTRRPAAGDRGLLMSAVTRLSLTVGYTGLTPAAIRRAAGVSSRRFEEHFDGVDDCLLAAIEHRFASAVAEAEREASTAPTWERRIVRMTGRLCASLPSDPDLVRLGFQDVIAPRPPGMALWETLVTQWSRRLFRTAGEKGLYGEVAAEASIAACWRMANAAVSSREGVGAESLAPAMAFTVLAPATGSATAERAIVAEFGQNSTVSGVGRHLPYVS
jgi:AcrR family transcriptional regulator